MDRETYDRLSSLKTTFLQNGGGFRAKLKVRGTEVKPTSVAVTLGSTLSEAIFTLSEDTLEKVAPAFGEEFVVEVRRLTEEEKEAAGLREVVDYFKKVLRDGQTSYAAQYLLNHPEVREKVELLKELLGHEVPGVRRDEFFERVEEFLKAREAQQ